MMWSCWMTLASALEHDVSRVRPEGLNELKQFVLSIATSPDNLACIVETSYGLLINFLLSAGFPVY